MSDDDDPRGQWQNTTQLQAAAFAERSSKAAMNQFT